MTEFRRRFKWTVSGESYHEGSSQPWRGEHYEGEVVAEHAGPALHRIVTGIHGEADLSEDVSMWDLVDGEREIVITIAPVQESGRGYEPSTAR